MDKFLIDSMGEQLFSYSLLSFYRKGKNQIISYEKEKLLAEIESGKTIVFETKGTDNRIIIIYQYLDWDSVFFDRKTVKIKYVFYDFPEFRSIMKAVHEFVNSILKDKNVHILAEIPSMDTNVIQALSGLGFFLNETRINYYLDITSFNNKRFNVREALISDIDNLVRVSKEMKNPFDRFHSDPFYTEDHAKRFLGKYIEESIKGFADIVIVPNDENIPADSFYAGKYLKSEWKSMGIKASKIILSAVSSKTNQGWFLKLNSEMIYHLRDIGAQYVFFQTAAPNKAVIHVNEKLGYKIGHISHYFSYLS